MFFTRSAQEWAWFNLTKEQEKYANLRVNQTSKAYLRQRYIASAVNVNNFFTDNIFHKMFLTTSAGRRRQRFKTLQKRVLFP